jgi:cytochrome c553
MRQIVVALWLLSCAGDGPRRAPEPVRTAEAREPGTHAVEPPRAPAPEVALAAAEPAADRRAAIRQAAHDALAEHCGACHEGHRSTNAKALAVYDLDQPDWPGRFNEQRFASALRRLAKTTAAAQAAFIAFRDAELAAATPAPPTSPATAPPRFAW